MTFWQRLATLLHRLPARSASLAIANVAAFAVQGIFAVLLLGLFAPSQVAVYFVVTQIAFFWHALAIAQGNTALIANAHVNLRLATRQIFIKSCLRLLALLPLGYLALYLSNLHTSGLALPALLLWALMIAFFQMAWYLAQAYLLRNGSARQSAAVRVLPPLVAALVAYVGATSGWQGPVLLLAALLGFAIGASWLLDAWRRTAPDRPQAARPATQQDDRQAWLRLLNTVIDSAFFTGIAIAWQSTYGGEHAGWLLTLMRLLGFIPSLVHVAWLQVVLANPEQKQIRGLWVALASSFVVVCAGIAVMAFQQLSLLPQPWHGLNQYIAPVTLWQIGACFSATFSYLVFAKGRAKLFTWLGMGMQTIGLLVLFIPTQLGIGGPQHFWLLAGVYTSLSMLLNLAMLRVAAR